MIGTLLNFINVDLYFYESCTYLLIFIILLYNLLVLLVYLNWIYNYNKHIVILYIW